MADSTKKNQHKWGKSNGYKLAQPISFLYFGNDVYADFIYAGL